MLTESIVIVSAARTPIGSFQGALSLKRASELGAVAIRAAVERAGIPVESIDEVIMGNVLGAGQGQAPARQASLGAGLKQSTGCTTVNKMCGSGMKATMLAHDLLKAGINEVMVSGGMESMTNAPYLLPKARAGMRMGHQSVIDHMFVDGLEDAYEPGWLMGKFAQVCADTLGFTRAAQDEFAMESLRRAKEAISGGVFDWEIAPVEVASRAGDVVVRQDESPGRADIEKIPKLKPAFANDGTITPANSSSISDGAAALVLMRESTAAAAGLKPLARILGHATHAAVPREFPTAPIGALNKLCSNTGLSIGDFDLFEINAAFAMVTMAAMSALHIPIAKVNVHGGACALGHPIGATGARIIVTLIGALRKKGLSRGAASLCIGGGEATAIGLELV